MSFAHLARLPGGISLRLLLVFALAGTVCFGESGDHARDQSGRPESSSPGTIVVNGIDLDHWRRPISLDAELLERTFLHSRAIGNRPENQVKLAALEFQGRLMDRGVDTKVAATLAENFQASLADKAALNSGQTLDQRLADLVTIALSAVNPKLGIAHLKTSAREFSQLSEKGAQDLAFSLFSEVMEYDPRKIGGQRLALTDIQLLHGLLTRAATSPGYNDAIKVPFKLLSGFTPTESLLVIRSDSTYARFVPEWTAHYEPKVTNGMSLQQAVDGSRQERAKIEAIQLKVDDLIRAANEQMRHMDESKVRQRREQLAQEIRDEFSQARSGAQLFSLIATQIDKDAGKAFTATSRAGIDIAEIIALQSATDMTKSAVTMNIVGVVANLMGAILGGPSPEQLILEQVAKLRDEVQALHKDMLGGFDDVHLHLNALERHLDNRFSDLDTVLRSTNESVAKLSGKVDLSTVEVREMLGAGRAASLDTLFRKCQNRSALLPMTPSHMEECLTELATCAETMSRDALATGAAPLFEKKEPPSIPELLTEAESKLDSNNPWKQLNFLSRSASLLGNPMGKQALPSPALWAICSRGYLEMMSRWPKEYQAYDPDLSRLRKLHQAGEDLRDGLSAIASSEDKPNRALFDRMVKEYRDTVTALGTKIDTIRSNHETSHLAGYDMRLDNRQPPIVKDRPLVPASLPPCKGSWAEKKGLPALPVQDREIFAQYVPNTVRLARDMQISGADAKLEFCYDIPEVEFAERDWPADVPQNRRSTLRQAYVKSVRVAVRASYGGAKVFARAIDANAMRPVKNPVQFGILGEEPQIHGGFFDSQVAPFLQGMLPDLWARKDGLESQFASKSIGYHFGTDYPTVDLQDQPSPNAGHYGADQYREMVSKRAFYNTENTVNDALAAEKVRVQLAQAIRGRFEQARSTLTTSLRADLANGTNDVGKLAIQVEGARSLLEAYMQLGLPGALRDDKALSVSLGQLPTRKTMHALSILDAPFKNEVDRRMLDADNPTYPKVAREVKLPDSPVFSIFESFGVPLTKMTKSALSGVRSLPDSAVKLNPYGELVGDPAAWEIPASVYAAYYKPQDPVFLKTTEERLAAMEKELARVFAQAPQSVLAAQRHPVVVDTQGEVLKALIAKEQNKPYTFPTK